MGLLDQIASVASKLTGQPAGQSMSLLGPLTQLISAPQNGGISGLIQKFQAQGLGSIITSWLSSGDKLPISPEQVKAVFAGEQLQTLASQSGLDTDQVAEQLTELRPKVVRQL